MDCPIHKHARSHNLQPVCKGLATKCIAAVHNHITELPHYKLLLGITDPDWVPRYALLPHERCERCLKDPRLSEHGRGKCPIVLWDLGGGAETEWARMYRALYPKDTDVVTPCTLP